MPELGTYTVTILLKAQEEVSGATKRAADAIEEMSKKSGNLGSVLKDVGKTALGVITGLFGFNVLRDIKKWMEDAIDTSIKFESRTVKLAALAREAGQDMDGLAQGFRIVASAISHELAVSALDAVSALEALVKAGLSGTDAAQALRGAIMLARIEGVDFATAGNKLVQVLAQFSLSGKEATRVVDVLINASRLGRGSANDFADALAKVSTVARSLGLNLEDTTTWLVILEKRFGSAQEAGTHLNRFLLELYEIAEKLNVPIRNVDGSLRNTNEIMLDVINATKALGGDFKTLQDHLQGVDIRALKTLLTFTQMTESFEKLREEISKTGSAWETYKKWLETTEGKMAAFQAENERLQRNIGEGFKDVIATVGRPFLQFVNMVVTGWRGIAGAIRGSKFEQYLIYLDREVRTFGRLSEETAAKYIKMWTDAGDITLAEALKLAEAVGIYNETIQELIDRAVNMGVKVPEELQKISSVVQTTTTQTISSVETQIKSLQNELNNLSTAFGVFEKGVALAGNFYDVTLKIMNALGYDVDLTEEAKASKERLAATQGVLNYITQAGALVQQALQLAMLGATDAANMLINSYATLTDALSDGIVTQDEFINILKQLGIDAQNVSGSLHNILVQALNAVRDALQNNINAANEFTNTLKNLDGLTAHTYHYHHEIIITETRTKEVTEKNENIPSHQSGAWYTHEGVAYLHAGEMVLPRPVAEWFRAHGPITTNTTKNVNVNVNVNAMQASDPHELAEIVSREIVRRLRSLGG